MVAIIGLLAAIAVPSYMKARGSSRRNACINNLRQIDAGKEEYALEYGGTNGDELAWDNVALYVKDLTNRLFCPAAKGADRLYHRDYNINPVGVNPSCKVSSGTSATPDHSILFKNR